jgi:competence protein ComEC
MPSTPRYAFSTQPLLILAGAIALGILVAPALPFGLKTTVFFSVVIFLLTLWLLGLGRFSAATLTLCLCFVCAGAVDRTLDDTLISTTRIKSLYEAGVLTANDPIEVTGVLEREPEPSPDGLHLTLRVEEADVRNIRTPASGLVGLWAMTSVPEVRAEYEALDLRYGTRLRVMCLLDRDERFRNPGVMSRKVILDRQGLDATGAIKSPLLIERLGDDRVFLPLALVYRWRTELLGKIRRTFSIETAGLLEAAFLGNRFELTKDLADRFRESGAFHVLVISGFHIAMLGLAFFWLTSKLTSQRLLQFLIPIIVLWLYTLAVGADVPVTRAAVVLTMMSLAPIVHRKAASLNALGFAALLLLLIRPSDLFDASFQLTILSVLSIVTISWPILVALRGVGQWRPISSTPFPPSCPSWFRNVAEMLHWSEIDWRKEMKESVVSYRLFKSPVARRLEKLRLQPLMRFVVSAIVVSASVQIGLLPLQVIYFHRLSPAPLLTNIAIGPLSMFLGLATAATLVASLKSGLISGWLAHATNKLCWAMTHLTDPMNSLGVRSIRIPHYTGLWAAVYVLYFVPLIALSLFLFYWKPLGLKKKPAGERPLWTRPVALIVSSLGALGLLIILHPFAARKANGLLRIDFLDVGQGDSALITMPDGATLLIDGGGKPSNFAKRTEPDDEDDSEVFYPDVRSIGDSVVSEYLWNRGLDSVDYILATHADADHIDGLNDIANNFYVRSAIVARYPPDDSKFVRFQRTMKTEKVPIQVLTRGASMKFGAVQADVIWPEPTNDSNAPSRNNDSLAVRLRYGDRVFLLTGDMEKGAENALLENGEDLKCDVIKVGHHGSLTSSTQGFVDATHPAYAVISVGLKSPFGHPKKEVVDRWKASGARTLTTGEHGTITFTSDGKSLMMESFVATEN